MDDSTDILDEHFNYEENFNTKDDSNKEQPGYYANIPAIVRYDRELTPNAKLLYGEITALWNKFGFCWSGNAYFAKLYDKSTKSVSGWISQLKEKNHIIILSIYHKGTKHLAQRRIYNPEAILHYSGTNSKLIQLKNEYLEAMTPRRNVPYPQEEKVKDNNTVSNTSIKDTNSVSKKETSDNSLKKNTTKENSLITFYNMLPNVQKHSKLESKVYSSVSKHVKRLKAGQFGKHIASTYGGVMNKEWFKEKGLNKWIHHKFTDDEIKEMFTNINNYFDPAFYPNGKKVSLETMFFNMMDTSGKSLALWLFVEPPVLGSQRVKARYPELVKLYNKLAFSNSLKGANMRYLTIALNSFGDFMEEKMESFRNDEIKGVYSIHAKWIGEIVRDSKIKYAPQHLISYKNGFWDSFVGYFRAEFNKDLEKPVETLKTSLRKDKTAIKHQKLAERIEIRENLRDEMDRAGADVYDSKLDNRIDHLSDKVIDRLFGDEEHIDLSEYDVYGE